METASFARKCQSSFGKGGGDGSVEASSKRKHDREEEEEARGGGGGGGDDDDSIQKKRMLLKTSVLVTIDGQSRDEVVVSRKNNRRNISTGKEYTIEHVFVDDGTFVLTIDEGGEFSSKFDETGQFYVVDCEPATLQLKFADPLNITEYQDVLLSEKDICRMHCENKFVIKNNSATKKAKLYFHA